MKTVRLDCGHGDVPWIGQRVAVCSCGCRTVVYPQWLAWFKGAN